MPKDWGLEWRLVPARARESCRWQSVDGAWIALALGHQKDITKVVVSASDGRSEVVEGYEEGLNLARRWRTTWARRGSQTSGAGSRSSSSRSGPGLTEEATQILPRAAAASSPSSPFGPPEFEPVWDDPLHEGPTQPAANSPRGELFKGIPRRTDPPSPPPPGRHKHTGSTPTQITKTWPPGPAPAATPTERTILPPHAIPTSTTSTPPPPGGRAPTALTPLLPERPTGPSPIVRQAEEVPPLRRRHTRPPLLPGKDEP